MKRRGALIALAATIPAQAAESALFSSAPLLSMRPTWAWVIGAALAALALGFFLGWRALDRRIRRKYGGLRIY